MASQSLSTSNYNLHNINHSSEPGQAQALLLNAPPSPPPTLKKSVFIFSPISSHNREPQTRIRRCGLIAQQPFHLAKQTGVKWFWVLVGLLGVFCWWKSGNVEDLENLRHKANEITKSLLLLPVLDGMHFTPATNQHIRYVGRWLHTPNQLRKDSSFPGAYLEFGVHNCSSVYVSLYNSDLPNTASKTRSETSDTLDLTRLTFRPLSEATEPLPPVSLLSQIDHGEYTYFRQAGKDLVAIAAASLDSTKDHTIRITAPGTGDEAHTGMQFEGIWLSDGGSLTHPWDNPESPRRHMLAVTTSMLSHESEHHSRRSLKNEVIDQSRSGNTEDNVSRSVRLIPHKTIEIVSEAPRNPREQTKHESLGRLKGWQDWVGDMFGVDHVSIAVDEMCLASSCMSSRSQLASITDAFFRSGPPGSTTFDRIWNFRSYIPDALVLMLGSSDEVSFRGHTGQQEKLIQDLQREFEETYIKFVKIIRRAAYPLHPAAVHDYSSNGDGFVYNSAPATLPIFVVSPFTGTMHHCSQRIVEKLQSEGDKAVFWLDTSGWFSSTDFEPDVDGRVPDNKKRRLNSQGNHKAVAFMHAHLCHYLAKDQSGCPFLKHEAYSGQVYIPQDAEINQMLEESKIKKLKALF